MKILTIVMNLDKGGTQRAAQNFAVAYCELGHDSRVIAVHEGGARESELKRYQVPYWIGGGDGLQEAIAWRPDLVHFHSYGIKHSVLRQMAAAFAFARRIETNVFAEPSVIENDLDFSLQLSDWCAFLYKSRRGCVDKVRIVPNPIDTANFFRASADEIKSFKRQFNIPENLRLVGRLGQAGTHNWSRYIVDAFKGLQPRASDEWHLLLCNPPYSLERLVQEDVALKGRYTIITPLIGDEKLRCFYSALDVFAHVADNGESFGMAIAEAMLCETPIISLNTPWLHNSQGSVVGHGIGGYCANTLSEFTDMLAWIATDEVGRRTCGKRGRERILERFSAKNVAKAAIESIGRKECWQSNITDILPYTRGDLCSRMLLFIQQTLKSVRVSEIVGRFFRKRAGYKTTLYELDRA